MASAVVVSPSLTEWTCNRVIGYASVRQYRRDGPTGAASRHNYLDTRTGGGWSKRSGAALGRFAEYVGLGASGFRRFAAAQPAANPSADDDHGVKVAPIFCIN